MSRVKSWAQREPSGGGRVARRRGRRQEDEREALLVRIKTKLLQLTTRLIRFV